MAKVVLPSLSGIPVDRVVTVWASADVARILSSYGAQPFIRLSCLRASPMSTKLVVALVGGVALGVAALVAAWIAVIPHSSDNGRDLAEDFFEDRRNISVIPSGLLEQVHSNHSPQLESARAAVARHLQTSGDLARPPGNLALFLALRPGVEFIKISIIPPVTWVPKLDELVDSSETILIGRVVSVQYVDDGYRNVVVATMSPVGEAIEGPPLADGFRYNQLGGPVLDGGGTYRYRLPALAPRLAVGSTYLLFTTGPAADGTWPVHAAGAMEIDVARQRLLPTLGGIELGLVDVPLSEVIARIHAARP